LYLSKFKESKLKEWNQQNKSHGNSKRSSPPPPPFMVQVPLNGDEQINGGKVNIKLGTCMVRE
jgi:hypothetical protein